MNRRDFHRERAFYTALAGLVEKGVAREGVSGMIIPGGRTPVPLYQRLFEHGLQIPSDFRFVLSDERYCPVSSQDSNQRIIIPLLSKAGVDRRNMIVPDTSLPFAECATKFDEDIGFFLGNGGSIDTAILGVGDDGHTAGIFAEGDLGSGIHASAVDRQDGLKGITCVPDLCRSANSIVFVLRGGTKEDIVEKLTEDPGGTVAGRLAEGHPNAEVWFCLE